MAMAEEIEEGNDGGRNQRFFTAARSTGRLTKDVVSVSDQPWWIGLSSAISAQMYWCCIYFLLSYR